jgi:hypothetical protein
MKNKFVLLMAFCAISAGTLISQNSPGTDLQGTKKMLYYKFTGPSALTELESLKKDVLLVAGVKEVKAECKPEKKAAQLRIVYFEKKKTREGDKEFDITEIKKLILKYNYVPGDFKIENAE